VDVDVGYSFDVLGSNALGKADVPAPCS